MLSSSISPHSTSLSLSLQRLIDALPVNRIKVCGQMRGSTKPTPLSTLSVTHEHALVFDAARYDYDTRHILGGTHDIYAWQQPTYAVRYVPPPQGLKRIMKERRSHAFSCSCFAINGVGCLVVPCAEGKAEHCGRVACKQHQEAHNSHTVTFINDGNGRRTLPPYIDDYISGDGNLHKRWRRLLVCVNESTDRIVSAGHKAERAVLQRRNRAKQFAADILALWGGVDAGFARLIGDRLWQRVVRSKYVFDV